MRVPNFENSTFVSKNRFLMPEWASRLELLFKELRENLSKNGIVVPQFSEDEINLIENVAENGSVVYDKTNHVFKGMVNGIFKTFDMS